MSNITFASPKEKNEQAIYRCARVGTPLRCKSVILDCRAALRRGVHDGVMDWVVPSQALESLPCHFACRMPALYAVPE